jgi:PadR family transcriptional regulator PadR
MPRRLPTPKSDVPPGALELLILTTLDKARELHGFEIMEAIERRSGDVFSVPEGSLYPALQRLLAKGWVTAEWGVTAGNRRARYYRITKAGRKQVSGEVAQFARLFSAIQRVIDAT